jgi:hypothetical protein
MREMRMGTPVLLNSDAYFALSVSANRCPWPVNDWIPWLMCMKKQTVKGDAVGRPFWLSFQ